MTKRVSIFVLTVITIFAVSSGEGRDMPDGTYHEFMRYSVSYLGIRIGTVEIRNQIADYDSHSVAGWTGDTHITLRTFSGIPFLSVLTEFFSKTDDNGYFIESITYDRERGEWAYYQAIRDTDTNEIIVERGNSKEKASDSVYNVEKDTILVHYPVHDALTFITLLRNQVDRDSTINTEVLIDRVIENIKIDLPANSETVSVKAFPDPVGAYYVTGSIDFTAIHGLSRRYQTWISRDRMRIPLLARVHIAIGSVKIELESYTMNGIQVNL
jgi:hypothetical protein